MCEEVVDYGLSNCIFYVLCKNCQQLSILSVCEEILQLACRIIMARI